MPMARRFHNDAVRAARAVRRHRKVRWFRLAGHAPFPLAFEMDDEPPTAADGTGRRSRRSAPDRPTPAAAQPVRREAEAFGPTWVCARRRTALGRLGDDPPVHWPLLWPAPTIPSLQQPSFTE